MIKFTPSIVDFGVVPLNFDTLRIPVSLHIREGHNIQALYLTEVLLPLNDQRLDFVMGNWDEELRANIQVYNKVTNRLEEHRRAHVNWKQELFVFTILLKPSLLGMVDQKIRMTFEQVDGTVHKIEYPILGLVAASSSVMVDTKDSNLKGLMRSKGDRFIGFLPPDPAIILDVSHELVP